MHSHVVFFLYFLKVLFSVCMPRFENRYKIFGTPLHCGDIQDRFLPCSLKRKAEDMKVLHEIHSEA